MQISNQFISALTQVGSILGLSLIVYGIHWIISLRKLGRPSFFKYIGIQSAKTQLDKKFLIIWIVLMAFAVLSTFLEFQYSANFKQMLMDQSSPYAKILNNGLNIQSIILSLIYCFIMASGSEEILFRGLIARRFFSSMNFFKANLIQSLFFWLMHLIIVRLVTGNWISYIQLIALVTSFGMGLVLGYANFRKDGRSILPSWILHGSANFFTFLTLAFVWPK